MRISGWIVFAAILMMFAGTMSAIGGLIAIIDDEIIVKAGESAVAIDTTTWGWIHLIGGTIVVLAGFAVLGGALWARIVTAILAGFGIISQIGFIDAFPFWSLAVMGMYIAVIYAVCTMGRPDEVMDFDDITATPDVSGGTPPPPTS